jgi:hypothetical protein
LDFNPLAILVQAGLRPARNKEEGHGSYLGNTSLAEFCRERTPWRSSPNVAYIPYSNGTQDPERHGVRSLQGNSRIATLTADEVNMPEAGAYSAM